MMMTSHVQIKHQMPSAKTSFIESRELKRKGKERTSAEDYHGTLPLLSLPLLSLSLSLLTPSLLLITHQQQIHTCDSFMK